MKIQLLVYGGKIFVQGLQLRKPGKKMKRAPPKSNKFWVDLFHVDTVVTSSGLSTGNVEQVTLNTLSVQKPHQTNDNYREHKFEIEQQVYF